MKPCLIVNAVSSLDSVAFLAGFLTLAQVITIGGLSMGIGIPTIVLGTIAASTLLLLGSKTFSKMFHKSPLLTISAGLFLGHSAYEMIMGHGALTDLLTVGGATAVAAGVALWGRESIKKGLGALGNSFGRQSAAASTPTFSGNVSAPPSPEP